MKTRLERNREKESLKQAFIYLFWIFVLLFLLLKFGLPTLIKIAGWLGERQSQTTPVESASPLPIPEPELNYFPSATNSSEIALSGFSQPGTKVKLYLRGVSLEETTAEKDGRFEFSSVHLADGPNEVYIQSSDNLGGISPESKTLTINLDTVAPELTVDRPQSGERFFDKDSPVTVAGKTEAGANLTLNGRFVLVKDDGTFSLNYNLNTGDNQLELVAKDSAGNETKQSLTVNYTP